MGSRTQPRFPVYIPSKSRADHATTPHALHDIGVPHKIVVEEQQVDDYARVFGEDRLLVFDDASAARYRESYDLCLNRPFDPSTESYGPGPVRNFIWEHSMEQGAGWHWTLDDNIEMIVRLHRNQRIPVGDGMPFAAMEDFVLRYTNVAMAGPHYWMFAPSRTRNKPFRVNRRIYSCNLIRNDVSFRWRGRYNEDTILSLDLLKAGWNTVLFNAFLIDKMTTQSMPGGNTEAFYAAEGTSPKSEMLYRLHPDVTTLVERWGRSHHYVDYDHFADRPLVKDPDWQPPEENPYKARMETGLPSAFNYGAYRAIREGRDA